MVDPMRRRASVPAVLPLVAVAWLGCGPAEDPVGETPAPPVTGFEVPISLPGCDPSDPSVRMLETDEDWQDINSEQYRVFCVAPGDYSALGNVRLARDGTDDAPRVLRHYDPTTPSASPHPVDQGDSERAILAGLLVTDARHWIIDGITITGDWQVVRFEEGSDHNVLNRALLESAAVSVRHGSHDNTIQNSVLRNAPKTPGSDRVCMVLSGSNDDADVAIHGTRIVNNEIYDCTDAIQAYRPDGSTHAIDFGGTIIDNNDLYVTDGMYTDCGGNLDPDGACACSENAIDLKAAGSGPTSIVQVSNNRMWGFKSTDTACGGTGSNGAASTVHVTARYTLYQGNIIWDVPQGMYFLNDHHSAVDNVVYDVHRDDGRGTAIYPEQEEGAVGHNFELYRNTIIDTDRWVAIYADGGDYRCNVVIDGGRNTNAGVDIQADYNFYYGSEQLEPPGDHDIVAEQAADAAQDELCFQVRRWTGPEEICIAHGAPTESSPHVGRCDRELGARPDVGVGDERW